MNARWTNGIGALFLGVILPFPSLAQQSPLETTNRVSALGRSTNSVVLLATWTWDVESNTQSGDNPAGDFQWQQTTVSERFLLLVNGAKAALVKGRAYGSIDEAFVAAQGLTSSNAAETVTLSGSDANPDLVPGAIVVFRTAEGHYGKLQVEGYRNMHDFSFPEAATILPESWKSQAATWPDKPRYHLQVRYELLPFLQDHLLRKEGVQDNAR